MNKHKKNKSRGHNLGGGEHKFYKAIKWHKFDGHNDIAKTLMFPNTWFTCTKNLYRMQNLTAVGYIYMENTIIEYYSNDVFGTLSRLPLSP
jgi:hypothetical protein